MLKYSDWKWDLTRETLPHNLLTGATPVGSEVPQECIELYVLANRDYEWAGKILLLSNVGFVIQLRS